MNPSNKKFRDGERVSVTVYLSRSVVARLDSLANDEELSRTSYIRRVLHRHLFDLSQVKKGA